MEEVTRKKEINGHHVYVTKLHGEGEEGQFHVVVANNDGSKYHTGDRTSSERFIKDNVKAQERLKDGE